jgi:hypothetical protein
MLMRRDALIKQPDAQISYGRESIAELINFSIDLRPVVFQQAAECHGKELVLPR